MLPWPSSEQEALAVSLPGSVPTGMCYCHQGPRNLAHLLPLWPPNLGMPGDAPGDLKLSRAQL